MTKNRKYIWALTIGAVALTSFGFSANKYFEISKNLDLFVSIYQNLNKFYVDDLNPEELLEEGIDAMLESLDPYTTYYPEEALDGYNMAITGQYGGIGALIRTVDDFVIIAEPYEDFPADKAGLIAGDRIVEIEGIPFKGKTSNDVTEVLRGTPGTKVNMVIEKPLTNERVKKVLIREQISIPSVPYYGMAEDGIGYIILNSFTNECSKDVKEAIKALQKEGELKGLVLDLRGNPGGLLQEAINISSLFIPKGKEVVRTRGRKEEWQKNYNTRMNPIAGDLPLAILTNRASASASEIVAGVMQDYDRAVIVGERTFGKGLVQSTKDLGYKTKLKLTTAKYYLPSGRCIQAIDYSGKYKDGAEKIPDSLRTVFKTENGRTVYDAGGVDPDLEVGLEELSRIAISLFRKQLYFNFATEFVQATPNIADPKDFKITDEIYSQFVQYIADKDYDYVTESEEILNELIENAKEENYFESIEMDVTDLQSKIKHDKEKDLEKHKAQISEYLESEIVTRYFKQKGRIAAGLDTDPAVIEAVSALKDAGRYQAVLKGQ